MTGSGGSVMAQLRAFDNHVADSWLADMVRCEQSVCAECAGNDVLAVRVNKDERLAGLGIQDG